MERSSIVKPKLDLDQGNSFIEYFFSIGVSHDLIADDFLYTNELKAINESFKIKPVIISKFPSTINKSDNLNIPSETIIKVLINF
jgi:hypothetical protein